MADWMHPRPGPGVLYIPTFSRIFLAKIVFTHITPPGGAALAAGDPENVKCGGIGGTPLRRAVVPHPKRRQVHLISVRYWSTCTAPGGEATVNLVRNLMKKLWLRICNGTETEIAVVPFSVLSNCWHESDWDCFHLMHKLKLNNCIEKQFTLLM